MRGRLLSLFMCLGLCLTGCGDPVGSPCRFVGSGFHASDNCRYRCLEHRNIECPDGSTTRPLVCSGPRQCGPGTCAPDQVCYHVADPFEKDSYCVPADICGALPEGQLQAWELRSQARSDALLEEWARKQQLRQNPAVPTQPAP